MDESKSLLSEEKKFVPEANQQVQSKPDEKKSGPMAASMQIEQKVEPETSFKQSEGKHTYELIASAEQMTLKVSYRMRLKDEVVPSNLARLRDQLRAGEHEAPRGLQGVPECDAPAGEG
jgi:hypothetical protein